MQLKKYVPYTFKILIKKLIDLIRYRSFNGLDVGEINIDGGQVHMGFELPKNYSKLMIDIGLSENAPNSALWLQEDPQAIVIGIEANKYNVQKLSNNGPWKRSSDGVISRPNSTDRFKLVYCAVDNVDSPTHSKFYHVLGDPGTSSMYQPNIEFLNKNQYSIHECSEVPTVSLRDILASLGLQEDAVIDTLKVDTQGKDLDILISAGPYLKSVKKLIVEVDTFQQYQGAPQRSAVIDYIVAHQFVQQEVLEEVEGQVMDVLFMNTRF